jgi:ABC-type amino acid transport system permease subunit
MERYEQINNSRKYIFFNNFLGGIAWALGATVGLTIIAILLGIILKNINLVPYVGNFITGVIEFIFNKNPNLLIK